jgi:hypothetical protein
MSGSREGTEGDAEWKEENNLRQHKNCLSVLFTQYHDSFIFFTLGASKSSSRSLRPPHTPRPWLLFYASLLSTAVAPPSDPPSLLCETFRAASAEFLICICAYKVGLPSLCCPWYTSAARDASTEVLSQSGGNPVSMSHIAACRICLDGSKFVPYIFVLRHLLHWYPTCWLPHWALRRH